MKARRRKTQDGDAARFAAWKQQAQEEAADLFEGNLGDIWAPGDDYDLFAAAETAFRSGQSPAAFIREAFAEDLARLEAEEQERYEELCEADAYDSSCEEYE